MASKRRDPNHATSEAMMRRAQAARPQLSACSACRGDYEDPERTAGRDDGEEEDAVTTDADDFEQSTARERFPVRER
jgi:hypothetical protein